VGCLACALAGVASVWMPPLASIALLDAILVTLVLVLARVHRRLAGELRPA
jgi:hypothetical protein